MSATYLQRYLLIHTKEERRCSKYNHKVKKKKNQAQACSTLEKLITTDINVQN